MACSIYPSVDSGTLTRIVALAGAPGAAGQPAAYLTLTVAGGGPAPAVTLTCGTGSNAVTQSVPYGGLDPTLFAFDGYLNVLLSYGGVPAAAPPAVSGQRFQLTFICGEGTSPAMVNDTVWSLAIIGAAGQTFAWVMADNEAESYRDVAVPLLRARSATVEGSLAVAGATTLAGLTAASVITSGGLSVSGSTTLAGSFGVTGPSTLARLTAQAATIGGSLGVAGPTTLTGLTAQTATLAGSLGVAGPSTLAVLWAQTATIGGSLVVTGQVTAATDVSIGGALSVAGLTRAPTGVLASDLNLGTSGAKTTYTWPYESLGTDTPGHNLRLLSHGWVLAHGAAGFWVSKDQGGGGNLTVDGNATIGGNLRATGVVEIASPSQATPFNVLTVNASSFGVPANLTQSYFIMARDVGANSVKFSVRGDGALTLDGNATINGTLTATHKSFVIDHPLDPSRKQLVHGCLEGPESGLYYRGEGQLSEGRAVVQLPEYFEALARREGRTVQLTPHFAGDEPVSQLAASSISDGQLEVRTADGRNPSQRFFWEVKAARADLPALEAERVKPASEDRIEA